MGDDPRRPGADLGRIGVIAIGRNEGARLAECLASIRDLPHAVYVDSASTDGSAELARGLGVAVVALEAGRPLTAASARDSGLRRLLATAPALEFVMFLDGDCTLVEGWLERALSELDAWTALAFALANLASKWAHLAGQGAYLSDLIAGRPPGLIEYRPSRR